MGPKIRCEARGPRSKNNLGIVFSSNTILLLVALLFIPRLIAKKPSVPFLQ
jgi:hypothetical protein